MAFPNPPIYVKFYTESNVKAGTCPPPPPVPQKFRVFGEDYDLEEPMVPSLPSLGLPQFFGEIKNMADIKAELKKLKSSIIAAFLDLTQLLITSNPMSTDTATKFEDLAFLFFNFHHLLNEFRVIQARATLVHVQREQNQKLKRVLTKMAKSVAQAREILSSSVEKSSIQLSNFKIPSPPIPDPGTNYLESECFDIWQVTKKHSVAAPENLDS
ncbi:hypothetical protein FO519_006658 [Halicephalobus sp. NKZ332]|nr:hypothetical protein FO519_006658 [Halicephalobus sp. NKZ332]